MDLTIAICTFNGAVRVPEVLDHLRRQTDADHLSWEVLVIDNNSTDDTAQAVHNQRARWRPDVPLTYILEERQGLAHARQRAVDAGSGEWIAFLDDDNLPRHDWVAAALGFARTHDRAAAFGGQLIGEYEVEPPRSFGEVQGLFAINDCPETFCYSDRASGEFAPGAGLVVRRSAWLAHVPRNLQNPGVSAGSRARVGEDIEAQWHLHAAGWEVWHNAGMVSMHKIPASRFSEEYLTPFFRGIGHSRHTTRMMRFAEWQRLPASVAFWINDLRKLFRHLYCYRSKLNDPFIRGKTRMIFAMLARPFLIRDHR